MPNIGYGTPATFVLRENIGSWALGSAMSNLATAKALVAAYGYSPWGKWIWAVFIGLQTPRKCLIPGVDLCLV
jgi:hypothetical protein